MWRRCCCQGFVPLPNCMPVPVRIPPPDGEEAGKASLSCDGLTCVNYSGSRSLSQTFHQKSSMTCPALQHVARICLQLFAPNQCTSSPIHLPPRVSLTRAMARIRPAIFGKCLTFQSKSMSPQQPKAKSNPETRLLYLNPRPNIYPPNLYGLIRRLPTL